MTPSRIFSAVCIVLALACTTPLQGQQSIEYSDDADALFKRGLTLFQEKQYGDAIAAFDQVIEQYP